MTVGSTYQIGSFWFLVKVNNHHLNIEMVQRCAKSSCSKVESSLKILSRNFHPCGKVPAFSRLFRYPPPSHLTTNQVTPRNKITNRTWGNYRKLHSLEKSRKKPQFVEFPGPKNHLLMPNERTLKYCGNLLMDTER